MLMTLRGKARGIVSKIWNRFQLVWLPLSTRKKLLFSAILILIVVGLVFGVKQFNNYLNETVRTETIPGPQEAAEGNLESLLKSPPEATASAKDRAQYYKLLSVAQADSQHFKEAAAAIKSQAQADPRSVTVDDYIQMAIYYQASGDKQAADNALTIAASKAPTTDDPERGYDRATVMYRIDTLRKEFAK